MAGSTYPQDLPSPACMTWLDTIQVCTDAAESSVSNIFYIVIFSFSVEAADGLICRLTAPCFIHGLDNARAARPVPTTIRRPTLNWKDISRCGRPSSLAPTSKTSIWCKPLKVFSISFRTFGWQSYEKWDSVLGKSQCVYFKSLITLGFSQLVCECVAGCAWKLLMIIQKGSKMEMNSNYLSALRDHKAGAPDTAAMFLEV